MCFNRLFYLIAVMIFNMCNLIHFFGQYSENIVFGDVVKLRFSIFKVLKFFMLFNIKYVFFGPLQYFYLSLNYLCYSV